MKKLKSSRYYQNWLQIVSRSSDILLFCMGYFLGKELFIIALITLVLKIAIGFTVSELMYKRMQAVVGENKENT